MFNAIVFWTSYFILKLFMKIYFYGKSYGLKNYPEKGPYIAVINHESALDVPVMALAVPGRARGIAKESLFKIPILGWWLKAIGLIPVKRGASDQEAFDRSLKILRNGEVFFIAPQGTRKLKPGETKRRARTGVVRLAQLADCLVVPVGVTGTREALSPKAHFPRRVPLRVKVGKPIKLPKVEVTMENREKLQEQAEYLMEEVYRLCEELGEK